ncbi:regulatory protein GemA [Rhizobium herbae]|uniref:Phage gp16-like protein n=1 Tax=Rhizobium herbae TaxID=508661 RepID=A0ABS4EW67_9HYPH|nr:regulatory protein GemA [Rhizobium herbae]MBP1862163.1 phage gp16-like protein [Rhizobium herbae]
MNATAIINIARQQLGIEEEAYRALLVRVTGLASLKTMSAHQHIAVMDEMKRLGFRLKKGGRTLPVATKPYIRLVHALWRSCHRKGVIADGSRQALRSFVKSRASVDDPDFLSYDQASPIIDALKAMEARG